MLENYWKSSGVKVVKILYIPATAALVGLLPLQHDGYTLVRIVVCAFLIYAGLKLKSVRSPISERLGADEARLVFFVIAAIYNPIFPLHLTRWLWICIDIGVAGYIFWVANLKSPEVESSGDYSPTVSAKQLIDEASGKADKFMSSVLWGSLACLVLALLFLTISNA